MEGKMEESQNFGHQHPLLLLNEEQISTASKKSKCSRCGENVPAPSLGCLECDFYLHKKCAEVPLEINHPFHRIHPLDLLQNPHYRSIFSRSCDFCDEECERFVYHCPCGLYFHIKCALFTYNIAEKNFKELEHVAHEDPLISDENDNAKELEDLRKCFACWEPLTNYTYFCLDCGFNLHKKCAELPLKINLTGYHRHSLDLQFNSEQLSCKVCKEKKQPIGYSFVYCCSTCKFVLHIECASPLPIIEDKSHQHPFTLLWRRSSFICDACGTEGDCVAYVCCTCNIVVHKKCTSLPRIIKSKWHDHRIFHTYFLQEDFEILDCIICHDKINPDHGSYSCSYCKIIFHVNCVTRDKTSYFVVSLENEDEKSSKSLEFLPYISIEPSTIVIERNNAGEATKVRHFKHVHNLSICDKITEYDNCCDGCLLPILDSFYHCSQCDFFLHKVCAELHRVKHVWHHSCRQPLILTSGNVFRCVICWKVSTGFSYKCDECGISTCIRCAIALTPGAITSPKHEHSLLYYNEFEGQCNACGMDTCGAFCCKGCNFALSCTCISLLTVVRHKCDEHLLKLTYYDDNDHSECPHCDICEKERDPNYWYYHCATCDTSAHIYCVLGDREFIKLESIYNERNHPHPLTFVKKIYYYPECISCGKPCQDLALECAMSGCKYIVHWECVAPYKLKLWYWQDESHRSFDYKTSLWKVWFRRPYSSEAHRKLDLLLQFMMPP